jgi:hypothetical protein
LFESLPDRVAGRSLRHNGRTHISSSRPEDARYEPVVGDAGVTPAAVSSDVMPELIPISCCKLFTSTICVMYAFGSVGWVGSWFFISATSSVRKSFAVMVELSAAAVVAVVVAAAPLPVVTFGFASALATLLAELDICAAPVTIC